MNNTNQRRRFLSIYRQQLRNDLNQMNYGRVAQASHKSANKSRFDFRASYGIAIGALLFALISLF